MITGRRTPSPGSGSGRGGTFGTPSRLPDEAPPSIDQESNRVVSGGGLIGPRDNAGPSNAAGSSYSSLDSGSWWDSLKSALGRLTSHR